MFLDWCVLGFWVTLAIPIIICVTTMTYFFIFIDKIKQLL